MIQRAWRQNARKWRTVGIAALSTLALVSGLTAGNAAAKPAKPVSLFSNEDTASARLFQENSVELGVRIQARKAGTISAVRFLKAEGERNTHQVRVWGANGKLLGAGISRAESASGWQQVMLLKPVTVKAGTTFTVSYSASRYMATSNYFSSARTVGDLTAPAKQNGVFTTDVGVAPRQSFKSTNYWVDAVFATRSASVTSTTSTPSPTLTSTTTTTVPAPTTSTTPSTSTSTSTSSTAAPTTTSTTAAPSNSGNTFPDRWSVGAPGVTPYSQTDTQLAVPAGYTVITPPGGVYNLYNCGSVALDHVYIRGFIYLGTNCSGTVTITNSIIAPPAGTNQRSILNNSNGGLTLNISDTTIRPEPVSLGGTNAALTDHATNGCAPNCHININRVDVANSGGMCLCGENTTIQNSWLHDNYIAHLSDPSQAHTGGVFPYGGSGPVTIRNNRLEPGFNAGTGQPVNNYWQAITAVLFTQGSGGTILRNYIAEGNFISLGAFDVGVENGEGLIYRNNVFGPNHWGETTTCSNGCGVTYADWSGNYKGDINANKTNVVVPHP